MPDVPRRFSLDKLNDLTAELRLLDQDLKANPSLNRAALREFRDALDSLRLTAWTVQELHDARQNQGDSRALMSFLTSERLRRFSQMVRDLSSELENGNCSWPLGDVRDLEAALTVLRENLRRVGRKV